MSQSGWSRARSQEREGRNVPGGEAKGKGSGGRLIQSINMLQMFSGP